MFMGGMGRLPRRRPGSDTYHSSKSRPQAPCVARTVADQPMPR